MFPSESEARRFFADRVTQRADTEGVPLSDDERQMLFWSESAPDSIVDPALADRLALAISDADYESKIAGLLRRSLSRTSPSTRARRTSGRRLGQCSNGATTTLW
jgi:hypothetical protein